MTASYEVRGDRGWARLRRGVGRDVGGGRRPVRRRLAGLAATAMVVPLAAIAGTATAASATTPVTLYVDSAGTQSTGCAAPGSGACPTIGEALSAAAADSGQAVTIDVAAGTYTEDDTINASGLASLTVAGAGAATTTINGGGNGTVLTVTGGTVSVTGLTITGGNNTSSASDASGGGVDNQGATLTLTGDTIDNNTSYFGYGGGVDNNSGGTVTLNGDTIDNNQAGQGGAVYTDDGSNITLTDDTLDNNTSVNGGAIDVNTTGTATLTGDTFSGDTAHTPDAGTGGGGIFNTGTVTSTDDTFSGDTAGHDGGGIYNQGTVTSTHDTFSGDTADGGNGGGIFNYDASVSLAADLLATPGGIPAGGECAGGGFTDLGYNVADDNTCGFTTTTSVVSLAAELLGPLQNNGGLTQTIEPTAGNPAIGRIPNGTSGLCPTTDQRGVTSPSGVACDAGSVQLAAPVLSWSTPAPIVFGMNLAEVLDASSGGVAGTFSYTATGTGSTTYPQTAVTSATVLPAGSYTLTATFTPSSAAYLPGLTVSTNLTVTPATPTVSITNLPATAVPNSSFTPTYTTSGDGTVFDVTASPAGVCSVSPSSGTVEFLTGGTCTLTPSVAATNNYTQATGTPVEVTVVAPATITSPATAYLPWLGSGSFTITTAGTPTATVTETGTLPYGLAFTPGPDGTATIAGTAGLFSLGTHTVTITATNRVGAPAVQTLTVVVGFAPVLAAPTRAHLTVGHGGDIRFVAFGYPVASLTATGALPAGMTFVDNGNGTATLAGTPATDSTGVYNIEVTATNPYGTSTRAVTIDVNGPPVHHWR